ncbi:MAG: hypothetical protein V2B15_03605 [Bacteroidota bacterium]
MREVMAPFVPMAQDVKLENENNINCKCTLVFSTFNIYASWDRLIIRYDGVLEGLSDNNSIVQEPFFNLFGKIKETRGFGKVINCLCATIFVNHMKGAKKEELVGGFVEKHLKMDHISRLVDKPSDTCIVLERNTEGRQVTISYGPYLGIEDIQKRSGLPKNPEVLDHLDIFGEMIEVKIFETDSSPEFRTYKRFLDETINFKNLIWDI